MVKRRHYLTSDGEGTRPLTRSTDYEVGAGDPELVEVKRERRVSTRRRVGFPKYTSVAPLGVGFQLVRRTWRLHFPQTVAACLTRRGLGLLVPPSEILWVFRIRRCLSRRSGCQSARRLQVRVKAGGLRDHSSGLENTHRAKSNRVTVKSCNVQGGEEGKRLIARSHLRKS